MGLEEKIKDAMAALKLSAEMSKHYYNKPLVVCYSGGKDSDVLLDIAIKCLAPGDFEVVNSHTTVDAPETVYHIRDVFKDLEEKGIHTEIIYPSFKGERTTMWALIPQKLMPPTRLVRYCCYHLKETTTPNRLVAVGVREDESTNRRGRDVFSPSWKKRHEAEWRSLSHVYAMFEMDKMNVEGSYECKMIEACKEHKDTICNPIYKFTEKDIWEYVKKYKIPMNPLYEKGYSRVGCIGCPMGGCKQQRKEFKDYPKFKDNYIRAFDRMLKVREEKGLPNKDWKNGEEVFKWWLGEDPKQVTFDDLFKENEQ